jgi:predicted membrane protein
MDNSQLRNLFGFSRQAIRCVLASAIVLASIVLLKGLLQAQAFTPFDVPGAGTGKNQGTLPVSINSAGMITGFYYDANGLAHGFVRASDSTITSFDAPTSVKGTFAISINTGGQIVGFYLDAGENPHGFVRAASKPYKVTTFDASGAGTGTSPISINSLGQITGVWFDTANVYHGFVRAASKPYKVTTFDTPGAGTGTYQGTKPTNINTAGVVTGMYSDESYLYHGFVRAADGTITPFSAPGASTGTAKLHRDLGTIPASINTAGAITGSYTDAKDARHGFVRAADGTITTFSAAGAVTNRKVIQGTAGFSVNDSTIITGAYLDASGILQGFVRAADGTITPFSAPGAANGPSLLKGTGGLSINETGYITGAYTDAKGVAHGYLLAPAAATEARTALASSPGPSMSEAH